MSTKVASVSVQEEVSAIDKTQTLIRRNVPIGSLEPNELNPNEMGEVEFNLLYDNVERMGLTEPILVRPLGDVNSPDCRYSICGGHHRWEVAKLQGFEEVPVTVVTDPDFDAETEKYQMVRYNVIHGKMNPKKFMNLYESLSSQYTEEVAAEMFGFASEEEFRKLIRATAKSLPEDMQGTFLEASKEIKTINDLSILLNRLFSTYGDTVPYGYMIFDYGGQDHIWLRMKKNQKEHLMEVGRICQAKGVSIDGVVSVLLQLVAIGDVSQENFMAGVASLPQVSHVFEDVTVGEVQADYSGVL